MTVALIVRLNVREGKQAEFEAAFADQARGVRADEPGNRLYSLARSKADPQKYVVLELYEDEAALAAHRASPHLAAGSARIRPLLGDGVEVDMYEVVV